MASTCSLLLLVLLLTPSLKILILSSNVVFNGFNTLSNLISCVIFRGTAYLILSFLRALKLLAEAFLSSFEQLAETLKSILAYVIELALGITSFFVLVVFEFMKNVIFGLFVGSGSTFEGLLETSFEGSLMEQIREIIGSISQTMIDMILEIVSSSTGSMFDFVKDTIFGLLSEPGSTIGGLLDKTKTSLKSSSMEQIREIVGSFSQMMINTALEITSSATGSVFDFVKDAMFGLVFEPGSTIRGLLEKAKTSLEGSATPMEAVREIVRRFSKKMIDMVLGAVSSSTGGVIEVVNNIFGLAIESGSTVGGLLGKTKTSLEALRVEVLREIIKSFSKMIVDMLLSFLM